MTDNTDALPPLPASQAVSLTRSVYTADDMHAYASAALAPRDAEIAKLRHGEPVALTDDLVETFVTQYNDVYCDQRRAGVTGGDAECKAMREVLTLALGALASPPPAPVRPEPVAWLDEFGNTFPLAAWEKSQVSAKWRRLYLASPPPAQPAQSLLRKPVSSIMEISATIPGGCYCPPDRCGAPVIMGRQTPCLRRDDTAAQPAQAEFHNPWRTSLENCISGDNYLRASEYRDLIEELDELYRLRAAQPPRELVQPLSDTVSVCKTDANNYCRILTALGMEEEGDPVAEVERLITERMSVGGTK